MDVVNITSPIDAKIIGELTVGTPVLVSGVIYTARDAAHPVSYTHLTLPTKRIV